MHIKSIELMTQKSLRVIFSVQKWQRRKDERPIEIMLSALNLFISNGFAATKIVDIAKQAGVSKGTVYRYFESKEALFKKMILELMVPKISEVERYIDNYQGSQIKLLNVVILQWWQTVKSAGLVGVPKLILSEADNFPELTKLYMKEVVHRILSILVNIINTGIECGEIKKINPELSSRVIMSSLVYFSMWDCSLKKYDKSGITVESLIKQQIELIINGISVKCE